MQTKERVTVTLDADLVARIDELAERRGRSRSAQIERILRYGIEEYEESVSELEGPLSQAVGRALLKSPKLFKMLARAVNGEMSAEEFEEMYAATESDLDHATKRRNAKRKKKDDGKLRGGTAAPAS